jgi:large subunit ribosomal protein L17
MRHGIGGRQLGRPTGQRLAMYRTLVTDLLHYDKIQTTEAKAKEIQAQVEKLVTLAKRGDLHARRLVLGRVNDPKVVEKLFGVLAPRYATRSGGYTQVIKTGPRKGDGAPMAIIRFVD